MELSPEDRERIYQEEKVRHEARESIEAPRRKRRTTITVMWIVAVPLTLIAFEIGRAFPELAGWFRDNLGLIVALVFIFGAGIPMWVESRKKRNKKGPVSEAKLHEP